VTAMRIETVLAAFGERAAVPETRVASRRRPRRDNDPSNEDEVCLQLPDATVLTGMAGQAFLTALVQDILSTAWATPVKLDEVLRTDALLSGEHAPPAWFPPAQHALLAHGPGVERLGITGNIRLAGLAALPFVLDIQLLRSPHPPLRETGGVFTLEDRTVPFSGACVTFTLVPAIEAPIVERDDLPLPPKARSWPAQGLGTPLFVQFAPAWEPDILCLAGRLLPAGTAQALLARPMSPGDGSYPTMEEPLGKWTHQVDVSA